jgi:hypothetical protein
MVTLTNVGVNYDANVAAQGLGFTHFDFRGVATIDFLIRVNKVGAGTQSWQLWATDVDGVSNGSQIGVIDDAGSTGVKTLAANFDVSSINDVKVVRVRAKSTTATDDPVFLGCSIFPNYP